MLNKCLKGGSPTYENREAEGAVANFETNTVQPFVKCECTIDATESGTSVLNVEQRGANVWNFLTSGQSVYPQGVDEANKTISWRAYADRDKKMIEGLPFKANTQYTFILKLYRDTAVNVGQSYGVNMGIKYTDGTTQPFSYICEGQNVFVTFAVISMENKTIDSLYIFNNGGNTILKYEESGVFEGVLTTADFEPYTGSTYAVNLEETAYGGSVDVIAGSGRIIDEHGNLVYTLFEPVSISALEGVNNVWCDTGDIEVTYKYKTGEGGSSTKKYLPIFYDLYGEGCRHL